MQSTFCFITLYYSKCLCVSTLQDNAKGTRFRVPNTGGHMKYPLFSRYYNTIFRCRNGISPPVGGKRKKIEKGSFRTKKEAETALAKAIAEYENSGQIFQPSTISVSDYLDFWYAQYCIPNMAENTLLGYRGIIDNHLKPHFGAYRLHALQAAAIQEFVNALKRNGYAKSTVGGILSVLSAAMTYAVEPLHYIKDNPCQYVKIGVVAKPPRERVILDDASFNRIIERFPIGSRFYLPLMIGWNCGLRISECLALTWEHIDFENRILFVEHQIVRRSVNKNTFWTLREPKYDSKRKIKFGETLYRILKDEKKRQ